MDWFRWHHGTVADPKFRWVAMKSGQSVAVVLAIWACLLERASTEDQRGWINGFDFESYDVALGLDDGATLAVYRQMEEKGMIDCGCIVAWAKRQPKYEDPTAAERKRNQREREKVTQEVTTIPDSYAPSQNVTACHDRLDKTLKTLKETPENSPALSPAALKPKKAITDPRHKWLSRWWCWSFENVTGSKYAYGKDDAGIIATLLKKIDFAQTMERACCYLLMPDEQRFPRGAPTLKGLQLVINQLAGTFTESVERQALAYQLVPPKGTTLQNYRPWET